MRVFNAVECRLILAVLVLCGCAFIASGASVPSPVVAAERSQADAAFERLKSLVGTWETFETSTKRAGVATYRLTGGGKVVIEEFSGGMATAYHLDRGALVLTHFCGAGNQPRMRAKSIENEGRHVAFEMYDITNHPNPESYYTSALNFRILEDGRVELNFRGMTAGSESSQTFVLKRRSSSGE
jgi:hypothetical protein